VVGGPGEIKCFCIARTVRIGPPPPCSSHVQTQQIRRPGPGQSLQMHHLLFSGVLPTSGAPTIFRSSVSLAS
jgi:hypothetical protein